SGEALAETIAHVPAAGAGPGGAPGAAAAAGEGAPRGQHRYSFGSGARPLDGYTIKRAVGRGGFGEVYYATSDAGKEVALKLITRNLEVERRGVVQCMNLKCPNLITIYDIKTGDDGDTFVVMEYVAGPSLAQVLAQHPDGLPLPQVRTWLKGLVEGVAYLHDHGTVHRDLKPANLFLDEGIVKIGDYGLSKAITQTQDAGHSASVGTCYYMAPEIASGKYHNAIDIYAIGVILYEMLTGTVPFQGETPQEVLMKHLTAQPDLAPLPEPYRGIVARALAKDPAKRPVSAYELLGPADAPPTPDVRIIGEPAVAAPPPPSPAPFPAAPEEDILRIEAEEPVFYIGPDTWPTRRRPPLAQRLWGRPAPVASRPARRVAPPPPPPPRAARPVAARPVTPPAPPPPPPPLPDGRVRLAELATSMLLAAPLAILLALPVGALLGVDMARAPQQAAYLVGLTLLGTWGVLIPNKLWEGRAIGPATRRLCFLIVGTALGTAGLALGEWTRLTLAPSWRATPLVLNPDVLAWAGPPDRPNVLAYAVYFGLAFGAIGWGKLTARHRPARLRIGPVVLAGLLGAALGVLWPFPQPWGTSVVALVAVVSQIVSPWNRAAADSARRSRRQVA
ncbi:MAG TPA: serine/threonine-protein kinase, partial [Isosphaeraceae bacterium]